MEEENRIEKIAFIVFIELAIVILLVQCIRAAINTSNTNWILFASVCVLMAVFSPLAIIIQTVQGKKEANKEVQEREG